MSTLKKITEYVFAHGKNRDDNGFYSDQMIEKLNNGIEFKRL